MKQLKFILAAMLLMVCGISHAQKVIVYKSDGTKVEYNASEVKDVKYKPVYYWYAGWTEPTEENLATIINEEYPTSSTDPTTHKAGGSLKTNTGYTHSNPFAIITDNRYNANTKAIYYVVFPSNMIMVDPEDGSSQMPAFDKYKELKDHVVYTHTASRNINQIEFINK